MTDLFADENKVRLIVMNDLRRAADIRRLQMALSERWTGAPSFVLHDYRADRASDTLFTNMVRLPLFRPALILFWPWSDIDTNKARLAVGFSRFRKKAKEEGLTIAISPYITMIPIRWETAQVVEICMSPNIDPRLAQERKDFYYGRKSEQGADGDDSGKEQIAGS